MALCSCTGQTLKEHAQRIMLIVSSVKERERKMKGEFRGKDPGVWQEWKPY